MENKRTVIFLDYFDDLEPVVPLIERAASSLAQRPVVVSANFDNACLSTGKPGLEVVYSGELLEKEDYGFIDKAAYELIKNWHLWLRPVEGVTEYAGIRFGSLTEETAHRSFSTALKRLEITLRIIERFSPARIVFISDSDAIQDLCNVVKNALGLSTLFVRYKGKTELASDLAATLRRFLVEKVSNACDVIIRKTAVKKNAKRVLLVDRRLYDEVDELKKECSIFRYVIEKGMRLRIKLLRNKEKTTVPLYTEDSVPAPFVLSPYSAYWRLLKKDAAFHDRFVYKKVLVWGLIENTIRKLIVYDFPRIKKNIKFLTSFFKRVPIKGIVMREAVRELEKTIALTARQACVPTLVIQHGLLSAGTLFYSQFYPDKMALWGKEAMNFYRPHKKDDINGYVITGKPMHDVCYLNAAVCLKAGYEILRKAGVDTARDTILYIPACFKWADKDMLYAYDTPDSEYISLRPLLEAMRHFPEKQLLIKMHPFDLLTAESLRRFVKGYPNVFVVKNEDILALIAKSVLVITSLFSSAGLDAVIFKKPLITLNLYKRDDLVPFADYGVSIGVRRKEDILPALKRVFEDETLRGLFESNRGRFISDYAYTIDGKSGHRVRDLIRSMCEAKAVPI